MDKETKKKLREGRDALQANVLPDKWEVIEMYDLINDLDSKLERIKTLVIECDADNRVPQPYEILDIINE